MNTPSLPPSLPPSTFASLSPSSQGRARQLLQAGYPTPQSLASLSPSVLCERVDHLYPKQARRIIQAAKVTCRSYILATLKIVMWYVYVCMCVLQALLQEKAEVLFEEAADLMSGLPS